MDFFMDWTDVATRPHQVNYQVTLPCCGLTIGAASEVILFFRCQARQMTHKQGGCCSPMRGFVAELLHSQSDYGYSRTSKEVIDND